MEDYVSIVESQNEIMGAMEKLLTNFKKDSSERKTPSNIRRRLETLEAYWKEFLENDNKLEEIPEKTNYPYFTENYYQQTLRFYTETKNYLEKFTQQGKQEVGTSKESCFKGYTKATAEENSGSTSNLNLSNLLRKQEANFKAFERTIRVIDVGRISEKWEFEDALTSLQSRWSAVDNLHWEIVCEMGEENISYETRFDSYENQFNKIKRDINSKMWSVTHREKSTPQLDIPVFNGNHNQWVSFKDLFTEAVHSNPTLSNAQKMQFLKSKVRGDAERLIQHLQISSENYNTCWDILNNRYNNKKLIFTSYISTLLSLPNIQQQSAGQLKKMHDVTIETLNAIKNLEIDISTWDPILVHLLSQKLDSETHAEYIGSLRKPQELPVLQELLDFLERKFSALESSRRKSDNIQKSSYFNKDILQKSTLQNHQNQYSFPKQPLFVQTKNNNNFHMKNTKPSMKTLHISSNFECPLCKQSHGLYNCKKFLEMSNEQKLKTVNKLKVCNNCLFHHNGNPCISTKTCRKCLSQHNTILHDAYDHAVHDQGSARSLTGNKNTENTSSNSHVSQNNYSEILLATAILKVKAADGTQHQLRALIDQGSQISLITEKAAQLLRVKRQKCKGVIFGVGQKENSCKGILNIECNSIYNNFTFNAEVLIMNNLIKNLPNNTFKKPTWKFLSNIQLADPEFYTSRSVDLLFGADIYSKIILSGIIKDDDDNLPIAQQTQLGWVLCGNTRTYQCNVILNNVQNIERFWEIEEINESSTSLSVEDQECIDFYLKTTVRNENGQYAVRLPLKQDLQHKLGSSKQMAVAQFLNLERKFEKQEQLAKDYKAFMTEYEMLKHMKLDDDVNPDLENYLPHHVVQRIESTTTKNRVVFNGRARTSTGYSLNDLMYTGPNLQQNIQILLLKWRQYPYAFTADIEKMYRQILINERDQSLQKIIWRDSPQQPLRSYKLTTVTYGTKAAPFLAMMTLRKLATDERHSFPEASKVLESAFYMDDLVHGCYTSETSKKLINDLILLLKGAGMNLRKWSANKKELLTDIKQEKSENNILFNFKTDNTSKTLGLCWNSSLDVFTFQYQLDKENSRPTKRILLSEISKHYDPLGWLSPLSTKLKLLFQQLWRLDLKWDDQVTDNIYKEWVKTKTDLHLINTFEIPRWLLCDSTEIVQLHGFCDASEKAYACVVYARIPGKSKTILVAAKGKLVPHKKALSLPKLELCGALLLSKLIDQITTSLYPHIIELYCWSDSMAVLGWIQGEPCRWKPFVSNRVIKITNVIPKNCWHYVKSNDNPADAASRGLYASQLKDNVLWWQGPSWIGEHSCQHNPLLNHEKYHTDLELRSKNIKQTNIIQTENKENLINNLLHKYNSITTIKRIIAWIRRALNPQRKQLPGHLTLQELNKAELCILQFVQQSEFGTEIEQLSKYGIVKSNSQLLNLHPIIDKAGILRVGGRLKNSCFNFEIKHPAIIPKNSRLTTLLIDEAHRNTFHGGPRLTLARLRQQYWSTGAVNIVKKQLRNCVTCRKQDSRRLNQIMGDLPEARINPAPAFYHTGVDFTGFLDVKFNKGRGAKTTKGYVAVFVCMVTKAVHLEMVSDLTSSAFLAALRRMAARRGAPAHIYSDNATNFHGANNILQQEYQRLLQVFNDSFLKEVTGMNISWHFTAPSWPSSGGLWERAVRSLKHHLRRVIGEQKLTFEEYATILTQLEACLNSRPLCALTEDIDDLEILTPAHFLIGRAGGNVIETAEDARTRWHLTTKLFQDIWKKWKTEYLSQLTARGKWLQPKQNLQEGDLVIIHEDNLPAGKWAMGRVTETHPGQDGYVRVVTLKTKSGYIKRPVVKLARLPVNSKEQNLKPDSSSVKVKQGSIRKPKKFSITTFIATIIYFLSLFTKTYTKGVITELNENQVLYFDPIANMQLIRDTWTLVVYYDMSPYWEGNKALEKMNNYLIKSCAAMNSNNKCNMIITQLNHEYTELQYYNELLTSQHFAGHARQRRGLVDGIGYLANTLFGVLDERFAEQYTRDIQNIRRNEAHLNTLWKNQTSIIESEYNLLKRTEDMFSKQHKIINKHLNSVEKSIQTMESEIHEISLSEDFTLMVLTAQQMLKTLTDIQQTLLDTVTDIYQGHFNVHLLTFKQLQAELLTISGLLTADVTLPIHNLQANVREIYKLLRVKARLTKDFFIFEIKIPLISRDTYDLYKIIPLPRRSGNYMRKILPASDRIAISLQKDSYIPVSQEDYQNCMMKDSSTLICNLQSPIYKIKNDQDFCVKDEENPNICKTRTVACQNEWHTLTKLNSYLYTCCGSSQVRTICRDQISSQTLQIPSIIIIDDDCVIKTDNFTLFAHKSQKSTLNIKDDLNFNIIAPINNIINITIHNFTESDQQLENEQLKKEIERELQLLKEADVPSNSLSGTITSHDIHHYTLLYCMMAGAALTGAIVLYRRMPRSRREPAATAEPAAAVAHTEAPAPPPARSTSMSGLQCQCSVSECSAGVRKYNSEPELKFLKPVSVPRKLVFCEQTD